MGVYFLDTSALVKRYIQETGTAWVHAITAPTAGNSLFVARITMAETVAAVTRRERGGNLAPADAATALSDFHHDFARQYFIVEISAALIAHAAALARLHALRGYDAVQLAAALEIQSRGPSITLVSADVDLNTAAKAEGMTVEDPNTHP